MTDLEDAVARERAACVMHLRLCEALDRGEPVSGLARHAYAAWVAAKSRLVEDEA
jgi:hypothetical protein